MQERFSDGTVEAWAERVARLSDDETVRIGAAVHSVRAVPCDDLAMVGEVASRDDRPLHVHLSEQPGENLACEGFYGCSPTELLAGEGLLTSRTTAVHATHLSDKDIELLGEARATACFCPTTERDLADGIGPARRLFDAGVRLSLGSDQHAVIDPFEEVRGVEMHERLESLERGRFAAPTCSAWPRSTATARSAGTTAASSRAVAWPTSWRCGSTAPARPARVPVACSTRRPRPTSPTSSSRRTGGARWQAPAGDVGRLLTDAISAVRR